MRLSTRANIFSGKFTIFSFFTRRRPKNGIQRTGKLSVPEPSFLIRTHPERTFCPVISGQKITAPIRKTAEYLSEVTVQPPQIGIAHPFAVRRVADKYSEALLR